MSFYEKEINLSIKLVMEFCVTLQPTHTIDGTLNSWFNRLFSVSLYLYNNITTETKIQEVENSYMCLMLYVRASDI